MIDPVTFEVLRHRLATIVDEGAAVMRNVSGSPSVAQSNDCNVALLTTAGEGVIIGRTIASHAMSCIQTSKYVLKEYQVNPGINPGDMFFTNHPYIGTPHQTCGVMVAPIFAGDRIIAWSGAGIHFGDVGGTTPGQVSIGAKSIWDEAIPMPPVKLVERGVMRRDIEDDFLTRSRTRVQNAVDLKAMVGAHNAMGRRVQSLAQRYGVDTAVEALDRVIATSELKLRGILREVPDGRWTCENFIDYYDAGALKVYACRLTMTKEGDSLVFDFTRSSKQAPAVVNATFAATEGYLLRAMLGMFGFAVTHCPAAIQRVVRIEATAGTIVNCTWPAGVCKGTTSVTQSVWQVATHCLSQMLMGSEKHRSRAVAVSRGNLTILDLMGTDQYGGPFAAVLQECCLAAGSAAGEVSDGIDTGGVTEPEVSIPNVENNEFRYPVLYLHRRQRRDSGGPGRFRGGVGLSMAFTPHDVDEIPNVMLHTHGVSSPSALGLAGGYPAVRNHLAIKRKSNIAELFRKGVVPAELTEIQGEAVELPPPFSYTRLGKGDVFECAGGGGGGYGDPIERAPDAVLRDVQNGVVSREAARAHYGVVVEDEKATASRRAAMRRARQDTARTIGPAASGDSLGKGVRCRCGQPLAKLSARDISCEAEAYSVDHQVRMASYVINETFCAECWSVVETRIFGAASRSVSFISLQGVSRTFGAFIALEDMSLEVEQGEFIAIVGPSGCGKSTLLQIVGGLLPASSGVVRLRNQVVTSPPREMIYVFQQYNRSLFPWRTVRRNIAFGMEDSGTRRAEIDRKCSEYIDLVGLEGFADHFPHQLSGGMQQRVAVARALAFGADVMLMDEPFGSVDAQTRAGLQDLVLRLWQEYRLTVLFVTHDIDEAIYVAQKVLVLSRAPAKIRACLATDLAYPRHQVRSKETPQYLAHRRDIHSLVFPS